MSPEIDIFWLCDRKCPACIPPGGETCTNEDCHHTSDKSHAISDAKNSPDGTLPKAFDIIPGGDGRMGYFEKEENDNGS